MKGFQFIIWKLTWDRFVLNDIIYDSDAFIIVFEAYGTVINNWDDFRWKDIKKAAFLF